ncbi:MAG: VapC toxin family PIN domain ribonuclease [bacterium (Candidatus Ratteibacteria) CG23_combo_of_CG06-09_8_20_14_all_48_7]|uniref:VapC toxin family PIN domain ribonuclease n=1 Tax=bacterium (Candidatus Ratteibacteria) CG23_combo_of_CG06-09_8_20_14_all_48_7 TaxID=2014292 RepID=A0A2G9Y8B3_9BACT|nr:MAG: VapC toxin family PIN domain ribonuclease [bacterium (Candidatus Ratteibacteria) CG23_combo_of_CG06-09_8_20_14_all_48_7]
MILYLDTSALVKLYFQEVSSEIVIELVKKSEIVATSRLAYVEAKAAFGRKRELGELSSEDLEKLMFEFERDWPNYLLIEVSPEVVSLAGDLAVNHHLRAYDALHLSSGLWLKEKTGLGISFLTFDRNQKMVAEKESLKIVG